MNEINRSLVLGAVDSLAVALSEHDHQWTEGERAIYEEAVSVLSGSRATEIPEEGPGDPDNEEEDDE